MSGTPPPDRSSFVELADAFLESVRRCEPASVSDFARRYPEHEEEIRALFPQLLAIESLKAVQPTGPPAPLDRAPAPAAAPGRIGGYHILRRVGAGGMGVVYEAKHDLLGAHFALKLLHPSWSADGRFRVRFRNEARSAARLHHTNIVSVFDFGEEDGYLYLVMPFIDGKGLHEVIEEARRLKGARSDGWAEASTATVPIPTDPASGGDAPGAPDLDETAPWGPIPEAKGGPTNGGASGLILLGAAHPASYHRAIARIGWQVADALAHAHGRGVVHRDIKPSNLLIDASGTPWLADFGLAKIEGSGDLTEAGVVVGTLRYLAPERLAGRSDARSDLYALGATLYEMLALRPMVGGSDREVITREILQSRPTPLRRVEPAVSKDFETIIHKAVASNPDHRFATAAEMAEELRRVALDLPIRSRRPPWHEQARRWCRRNPVPAALGAVAATLLTAVVAVSITAAVMLGRSNAEVTRQLARVRAAERERGQRLWEANLAQARAELSGRRLGRKKNALDAVGRAVALGRELGHGPESFDQLRDEAAAALLLTDLRVTGAFEPAVPADRLAVDEGYLRYVAVGPRGGEVRTIDGNRLLGRLPATLPWDSPRFGTGDWLGVMATDFSLTLWKLPDLGPTGVLRVADVSWWEMRSDGRRLVVSHRDGSISVYDLPQARLARRLPPGVPRRDVHVRPHPSSPHVVVTSYFTNAFEVRNVETGETLRVSLPWIGGACPGAWDPDGTLLAIPRGDDGQIAVYEFTPAPASVRHLKTIVDDRISDGAYLCFDGESRRLFLRGWRQRLSIFDVATGRLVVATPPTPASFLRINLRVDRAGRWAFPAATDTSPPQPAAWLVDDGRCRQLLTPIDMKFAPANFAVHPSGRLATATGGLGRLFVYDLDAGRVAGGFTIPGETEAPSTAFDGQGRWLVNSYKGCWRWPVTFDAADPRSVVIGPPERLPFRPGNRRVESDRAGTVISQMMWNGFGMQPYAGAWLLRADRGGPAVQLLASPDTWDTRVSPDGRWVAAQADGVVTVFDSRDLKAVWKGPRALRLLSFTPDGRWLALGDDGITYVPVGSWGPDRRVGPGAFQSFSGFSQDGMTAALASANGDVSLIKAATGRVLLTLRDRGREDSARSEILLTPDGSKLLLSHPDGLEVWDLARVRAGLAGQDLDWDAPTLPAPSDRVPAPLRVRFVGLDKLADNSHSQLPAPKSISP